MIHAFKGGKKRRGRKGKREREEKREAREALDALVKAFYPLDGRGANVVECALRALLLLRFIDGGGFV